MIKTRNRCVITIRTNPPMFIMKTKHLEQIQDIKDNLTFLEAREAIWRNWVGRRRGFIYNLGVRGFGKFLFQREKSSDQAAGLLSRGATVARFFALVTPFFASCLLIISHLAPFLLSTPARGDMGSGRGPKSECTPKRAILGRFCQKAASFLVFWSKRGHGCDRLEISVPYVVPKQA